MTQPIPAPPRCAMKAAHDPHEIVAYHRDDWIGEECPGVPVDHCPATDDRFGCVLPPTHTSMHQDALGASWWRNGDPPATVGRCGEAPKPLFDGAAPVTCTLPAGHAGWHRSDGGTEWGIPVDTDRLVVAVLDAATVLAQSMPRFVDGSGPWDYSAEEIALGRAVDAMLAARHDRPEPTNTEESAADTARRHAQDLYRLAVGLHERGIAPGDDDVTAALAHIDRLDRALDDASDAADEGLYLTADQEIRARALDSAANVADFGTDAYDVIDDAASFEAYIRDGAGTGRDLVGPDDDPTEPVNVEIEHNVRYRQPPHDRWNIVEEILSSNPVDIDELATAPSSPPQSATPAPSKPHAPPTAADPPAAPRRHPGTCRDPAPPRSRAMHRQAAAPRPANRRIPRPRARPSRRRIQTPPRLPLPVLRILARRPQAEAEADPVSRASQDTGTTHGGQP